MSLSLFSWVSAVCPFIILWFCLQASVTLSFSFVTPRIQHAPSLPPREVGYHHAEFFSSRSRLSGSSSASASASSSSSACHRTRLYESVFDTDTDTGMAYTNNNNGLYNGNGAPQSNGSSNGINGSSSSPSTTINGNTNGINGDRPTTPPSSSSSSPVSVNVSMSTTPQSILNMQGDVDDDDVPKPTANGGYSHTSASRAKIGAANKGKTPWNKGRQRSPEERARIAAGVRAKNRERFLAKLKDLGLTEEEYEAKKKEEKRVREAERRARRTAKGGFRPSEETKAKISRILKEKYANGEIKPRKVDPTKVRRGFKHSEETRAKIAQSLKKRWADDPEYRARMKEKNQGTSQATREETKRKISASLKKKWEDPEFRSEMVAKMAKNRSSHSPSYDVAHREKISRAMRAKWQDEEYRAKAMKSIATRKQRQMRERPPAPKKKKVVKGDGLIMVTPLQSGEVRSPKKRRVVRKKVKGTTPVSPDGVVQQVSTTPTVKKVKKIKKVVKKASVKKKVKKKKEPDGSVNRLREERRDLFDLLYGDDPLLAADDDDDEDDDDDDDDDDITFGGGTADYPDQPKPAMASRFGLNDEDLDSFDPYGLDDY